MKSTAVVAKKGTKEIAPVLKRGKPSRKVAREMLILEMRRLRAVFSEIAERYREDIEGRIASATATAEAKNLPDQKVKELLEVVQTLEIKPKKGRRKDLARIDKATDTILKMLEE
jgi:predicted transposase YdaD